MQKQRWSGTSIMRRAGLLFSLLIVCSCANATIINSDFILPGDGLVTTDSITGNQWLDPSIFAGMTYDQTEARLGTLAAFQGFHIATFDELTELMIDAGWQYFFYDESVGNSGHNTGMVGTRSFQNLSPMTPARLDFMRSIGVLRAYPTGVDYTAVGYIAGVNRDYGFAQLRYLDYGPTETNSYIREFGGAEYDGYPNLGAFIVRTVPEPESLGLMIAGLLACGLTRRRGIIAARKRSLTAHSA
jgi:hypothetical protein